MLRRLSRSASRGFSMIEILVAMVILLISVMGVAGLVVRTTQQEMESYQRIQALILLQDIVDRVNANRQVIECYSNGGSGRNYGTGSDLSSVTCSAGSTAQNAQAVDDMTTWDDLLDGAAEQSAASANIGAMIGARGCIVQVNAGQQIYRISIAWQGMGATVVPVNTCGQNSYGDETFRRTVSAVVRIGDLS